MNKDFQPDPEKFRPSRRRLLLGAIAAAIGAGVGLLVLSPPTHGDQASRKRDSHRMNPTAPTPVHPPKGREIATVAGGCFWCIEAIFQDLKGVDKVQSGYSGGDRKNPTYEQVCAGVTGHAEALQITFDPKVLSYGDLLRVFLTTHDPTTLNRQGADRGTQYRSAIFFHTPEQKKTADDVIKEIAAAHLYNDPIVTEVTPFSNFYVAEAYHQSYFTQNPSNPYCRMVIAPKVAKFREKFREKLKR